MNNDISYAQGECPHCGQDWTAHSAYIAQQEKICVEIAPEDTMIIYIHDSDSRKVHVLFERILREYKSYSVEKPHEIPKEDLKFLSKIGLANLIENQASLLRGALHDCDHALKHTENLQNALAELQQRLYTENPPKESHADDK